MEKEEEGIEIEEEPQEEEPYIHYEITSYPSDFTLEVLNNKWLRKEIIIPDFQRRFVWKQEQASLLIESFMLGLPVPNVFFYVDRESKSVVIDGQQRLLSVFYFFEGYFGKPDEKGKRKVFSLVGFKQENPLAGKTYTDIEKTPLGTRLRNCVLRAMNIIQLAPKKDDTSMYHIFERLNTGGVPLAPQEVRNCVFRGPFNKRLFELNKDLNWRKILGKSGEDARYKDVELILRIIALSIKHSEYQSPMKEFLNLFMKDNQDQSEKWLEIISQRFQQTTACIVEKLGEKPFRIKGPINTSMLDSIFTILMENIERIPADLLERYNSLKASDVFVQFGTNSTKAVTDRFKLVHSALIG